MPRSSSAAKGKPRRGRGRLGTCAAVTAVVFASRRPPLPLDNRARIRAQRLPGGPPRRAPGGAPAPARHAEVHLVTFADGPAYDDTTATQADLERVLSGVEV